jgi:hypothetical protein
MLGVRDATYDVLDDGVAPGMLASRRVWVCGICARPWMAAGVRSFTLAELRWLRTNEDSFGGQIADVIAPEQDESLLREVRRTRADRRVPVPVVDRVAALPAPGASRKRRIGHHKL